MKLKLIYLFFLLISLVSCNRRNLAYFNDLPENTIHTEAISNTSVAKIQPDDLLSITVTSLNPEANAMFNRGVMPATGAVADYATGTQSTNVHAEGYLVDENGFIDFPVLGKIKLGGMTKEQAKNCLISDLHDYLKDPIVNIRYLNYRVTVIGEVNRPSTFTIPSEKIHVLAALGLAGDMTPFGKRENVLIIREEGGARTMTRLNLNNKEVLNSPYFYLQQNDVVYVEPDKAREAQANMTRNNFSIAVSMASVLAIILTRIL